MVTNFGNTKIKDEFGREVDKDGELMPSSAKKNNQKNASSVFADEHPNDKVMFIQG